MGSIGRVLRTVARISRTRYPRFAFGLPPARNEIPVFTYHDVEPDGLAGDLEFLRSNGYRALCLDEYLRARVAGRHIARGVLLTFDDARKSFWDVALPLLRSFDMHAVLFAPSWWMRRSEDRCAAQDLFMSWEQLRACCESGVVDVQSHAHRHALVPIAPRIVDFANPQALARYDLYDWPMRLIGERRELGRPALGTPVYRAEPLLSASRCYLESGVPTLACRELVDRLGGEEFFRDPRWRQRLLQTHRANASKAPGAYLSASVLERLVESEFEASRAAFRAHLGYVPHVIAYPWMLGSTFSLHMARRHGFRAAFGVALDYAAERRRARLPLAAFGRLKCDWLRMLPGHARSSVLTAVRRKVSGLSAIQHLAH